MRRLPVHAEEILQIASAAWDGGPSDLAICSLQNGGLHLMAEPAGWTLPALAAETGAVAVYRVRRTAVSVEIEAWSAAKQSYVHRELRALSGTGLGYATNDVVGPWNASENDRAPQV